MDDNNSTLTATYFLALNQAAISEALWQAQSFAEKARCGENVRVKLAIIVEEVIANVVEHSACPPQSEIILAFARGDGEIIVNLSNGGIRFDPRLAEAPDEIPPERGGGAGIALIRAWAKTIDWHYKDGRNHLRLVIADHGD
jgi:serine/threonine-protein kinase RsbW